MIKKVYIVGTDYSVRETFRERPDWEIVDAIENCNFICLTGGADINPALYGQAPHKTTRWYEGRDAYEVEAYRTARRLGKKVLGICRGAQLMNALEGGDMYQHVNHHHGHHKIHDLRTNEYKTINSIHHQMMIPAENAEVVAVASGQSDQRELMVEGVDGNPVVRAELGVHDDPEVLIFYDCDTGGKYHFGLGFQGHPEYGHPETTAYFFELIERYF
jgi:gamma-glutamyl-gamma-aminobutyrate hydrolase PuuD